MYYKYEKKSKASYQLTKSKFLDEGEYAALGSKLKSLSAVAPRNTLMIYLAMYTGGRAQEILNLRPCDLDHKERSVMIKGLKDSDDRDIPIPEWLFERLAAYSKDTGPRSRIFTISYQQLRLIWHSYRRPTTKNFHALRHTFAIRLYRRTRDIKLVQQALGHRSFKNTLIYLAFSYNTDQMRRLIVEESAPC